MNPLSPTKRSSTFWTYSAWVIASFASAITSGALASPITPRSRLNTSPIETKVSTSIRMPWSDLVATLAFAAMFSP
jgi:hypothetical protein